MEGLALIPENWQCLARLANSWCQASQQVGSDPRNACSDLSCDPPCDLAGRVELGLYEANAGLSLPKKQQEDAEREILT